MDRFQSSPDSDGVSGAVLIACHAWSYELVGGSFKIATELAQYLAARGRRVLYVCGSREREPVNPTIVDGVELWRYPYPQSPSPHPANVLGHVWGVYGLSKQILRDTPVSCLNGHTPLQFLGASLAVRRQSSRQVYSVHSPFAEELGAGWHTGRRPLAQRLALRLARQVDRRNFRRATLVQAYSQFTADLLAKQHGEKVAGKTLVTPGWVDVERFHPVEDVATIRTMLGGVWQTDQTVFLSVRRLEARMGLEPLVQAAQTLRAQGAEFRLLIGGSGSMEAFLRAQIQAAGLQDTVHLLGRIPDQLLPQCYAAADCFVLPTRALECFGLIILEAYACGTPVIGTPVGAIPELMVPQGAEWLTRGTDAADIADRMAAFLQKQLVADRRELREFACQWRSEIGLERLSEVLLPGFASTP